MIFHRVLVVDDEPAARRKLRLMLAKQDCCEIIEEAEDGLTAIDKIQNWKPDLVFLDIQMPIKNGLQVALETQEVAYQLVFVTAFDEFALDAFKTHAVDYLLKPVNQQRLQQSIAKVASIPFRASDSFIKQMLAQYGAKPSQLSIKRNNATIIVDTTHIGYLEAVAGYSRIHLTQVGQEKHNLDTLISDTALSLLFEQLPEEQFIQVHRSYVVNVSQIRSHFVEKRRLYIRLHDYAEILPVSRRNSESIRSRWKGN